jgi:hypothetical protein
LSPVAPIRVWMIAPLIPTLDGSPAALARWAGIGRHSPQDKALI